MKLNHIQLGEYTKTMLKISFLSNSMQIDGGTVQKREVVKKAIIFATKVCKETSKQPVHFKAVFST